MKIERLELHNFRFFAKGTFSFPAPFTVLIGENGRGKSALLHGLRIAAGAWLLGFKETERLHIEPEDIRRVETDTRFVPQFPAVVRATGIVENQLVTWARQRNDFKGGLGRTGWAEAKSLIDLARHSDEQTNAARQEIALPVLVYFSTARLWVGAKKAVALKTKGSKIQDGYAQALTPDHKRSGPASRTVALGWMKKMYLKMLEEQAASFQTLNYEGPASLSELEKMKQLFGHSAAAVLLGAVFQAITTCVPDWTYLSWDLENDDLSGLYRRPDAEPERVPLYYLSDGLRTMAGMVAEIAYRCAILNGHLGAAAIRESRGVVLIDELDMHLHPNWQRHVVRDLKLAFPNLQFVVTTHSPFIVQSLDSLELINLDHPSDVQPKDLRLEEVATEVMNVDSALSIENEQAEQQALGYLQRLHAADQATSVELATLEEAVANPGLRAILRMERLLKEAKS
ncbi:AAA family ATPase [Hymenobacter ruricola]|uniref:AAA family ATPase n=1 Tax=Hymenobacter ruricola TaxID=2791023 RepID=A0ABS0I868_9BACT|nr:AAA family ATPase [Hymenobacter ruricola]MBF9222966.1 AAA family ATPase [Hymenobacter ruricola]